MIVQTCPVVSLRFWVRNETAKFAHDLVSPSRFCVCNGFKFLIGILHASLVRVRWSSFSKCHRFLSKGVLLTSSTQHVHNRHTLATGQYSSVTGGHWPSRPARCGQIPANPSGTQAAHLQEVNFEMRDILWLLRLLALSCLQCLGQTSHHLRLLLSNTNFYSFCTLLGQDQKKGAGSQAECETPLCHATKVYYYSSTALISMLPTLNLLPSSAAALWVSSYLRLLRSNKKLRSSESSGCLRLLRSNIIFGCCGRITLKS